MNFKSIIVLGLSIATLGLSVPAHADEATVINAGTSSINTGDRNYTDQNTNIKVHNDRDSRPTSAGTVINADTKSDNLGDRNETYQNTDVKVDNLRQNPRR